MISSVNSIGFKGAQTQEAGRSEGILTKAKAYNAQLKDTFNSNPEKKAKANVVLSGVTIAGILTTLFASKKAIPKYIGAIAATLSSVAALNLNWFSGKKEIQAPFIQLASASETQEAAQAQPAQAPEAEQTAAAPLAQEAQLPAEVQQMLAQGK